MALEASELASERTNERNEASSVKQANEWAIQAIERADEPMAQFSTCQPFYPLFRIQQIQNINDFYSKEMGGEENVFL